MPYIPPPRPPPAPPRINPPPVFRPPPGPSIQQRQFQQQQHFQRQHQQQQAVHRQQQQQVFHRQQQFQRQEEQRRFHQQQQVQRQLQADNMRQQQNQQHFLHQQDQQRQQEQLRRQQQQLHQDNVRHQNDHQRQQALLRDFHSSTEAAGPTVVHVAPNFTMEVSGVLAQAFSSNGNGSFEVEINTAPDGPIGPPPTATPQSPGATPPLNPDFNTPAGPPPPYFQQQAPPPLSPGVQSPSPQQLPPPPPPEAEQVTDPQNRILLKDGTQIIVKSKEKFLFIGPTGVPMVVNCLPLYDPPPNALDNRPVKAGTISVSPSSPQERSALRKARSSEELIESPTVASSALISDEEDGDGTRSDDEQLKTIAKNRQNWTRFSSSYGANYSIRLRETARSDSSLDRSASSEREVSTSACERPRSQTFDDAFATNKRKVEDKKRLSSSASHSENDDKVTQKAETQGGAPNLENGVAVEGTDSHNLEKATEDSSEVKSKQTMNRQHSESTSSEAETADCFSVNYLTSAQEIPMDLKRSSGSVSFLKAMSLPRDSSPPTPAPAIAEGPDTLENSSTAPETSTSGAPDTSSSMAPDISTSVAPDSSPTIAAEEKQASKCEDGSAETADSSVTQTEQAASNGSTSSDATDSVGADRQPPVEEPDSSDVQKVPLVQAAVEVLTQSSATPSAPPSEATPLAPPTSPQAKIPLSPPGAYPPLSPSSSSSSTPSPQLASLAAAKSKAALIPTSLPPSPLTIEPRYQERSGWLNKLSHRKGVFGDKWQKRYFVLHGCLLYYFKKYGDSTPKGIINLLPTGWCKVVSQGTRRMSDAVATSGPEVKPAVISVLRCLCVHRPSNFAASLSTLLATEGVAEAFLSQTVSVSNAEHTSRTFYMVASSNEERDAWVEAVQNNIQAYSYSSDALTVASKELRNMLRAVSCQLPLQETPPLLYLLHARRKSVLASEEEL